MSKSLTAFYRRSKKSGSKTKISSILDPLTGQLTRDQECITAIFTSHHEAKTNDPDVYEHSEPVLNSPKMFETAQKYGYDLHAAFPAQPDDNKDEVIMSLKEMKKLVTGLKSDMAPGKSGVDKYVLAWFIEYFPNVLLQAFNFLLAEPDWENLIHSA